MEYSKDIITYCIGIILNNMDELKYTTYYSDYTVKILEKYDRTMLKSNKNTDNTTLGIHMLEILFRIIYETGKINSNEKQLEFYDKLLELSIEYGMNKKIKEDAILIIE